MDLLRTHLRDALRRLRRAPGFTALSIATLALGLGATTAIFSVVYAVLLRPLPFAEPSRLVAVWNSAPGLGIDHFEHSHATYLLFSSRSRLLESFGLQASSSVNLTGAGAPERVQVTLATASLQSVLRVVPVAGRPLAEADMLPGAPPVALLSYDAWQRRFGGAENAIGSQLEIDGRAREIVGVLPPGLDFPQAGAALWLPLTIDPARPEVGNFNYHGVGRLRPGADRAQLGAELSAILASLPAAYPEDGISPKMIAEARMHTLAAPLLDELVGSSSTLLWVLLGTVGVVLLIACANVANLLLIRAEERQREMAVRDALGASPRQLVGAWMAESLLLTFSGGALGVLLADLGVKALLAFGPSDLPRRTEVSLNGVALALCALLAFATGTVFAFLPFLRQRRAAGARVLGDGARGATAGRARFRLRHLLVGTQVALALVLLVFSGLLVRSFVHLTAVDAGFRPDGVLTVRLFLPAASYPDLAAVSHFQAAALDRLRALPGVTAAGIVSDLPMIDRSQSGITIEDLPRPADGLPPVVPNVRVSDGYFAALGIPIITGRSLERADAERGTGAVLVSESFARHYWPGASPLGKRLKMGIGDDGRWLTVAGVAADVRHDGPAAPAPEMLYLPFVGKDADPELGIARGMALALRTGGDPAALARPLRETLAALDPKLPLAHLETMSSLVAGATAQARFAMALLLLAAAMALLLGAVGLYGVMSYLVSLRRREIGVRLALGAERRGVAGLVVRQGLAVSSVGLVVGAVAAATLSRGLGSLLYEISATDPLTFTAMAAVLLLVCAAASFLPARRAAAVAPIEALRSE